MISEGIQFDQITILTLHTRDVQNELLIVL